MIIMKLTRRFLQFILSDRERLSYNEEKEYIDSFPEPKDDLDRTRYHYMCVYHSMNKRVIVILNIVGIILCIPVFLCLLINTARMICFKDNSDSYDALLINSDNRAGNHYNYDDRIPKELYCEFGGVHQLNYQRYPRITEGILSAKVVKLWIAYIVRHPLSGWTNCHSLIHLAVMNGIITKYNPKIVINSRVEINYISSLLACFCEMNAVEYSCFMHGELLANIELAFVRFSRFYIWDDHYISLLKWARADKSRFITYTPDIFAKQEGSEHEGDRFDYTYYMIGTAEGIVENYEGICKALIALHENGFNIKIRPHPRWSDLNKVREMFKNTGIVIEGSEVSMRESLQKTKGSIGIMSTVLLESYYNGKSIVIDDITNPSIFCELENRMYLLLEKPHCKLSDLLNEIGHKDNE